MKSRIRVLISKNSDIAGYLPTRVFPIVVSLVKAVVLTRMLSPDVYGKLIVIISVTAIGNLVLWGWLPSGIIRFSAMYENSRRDILLPCVWLLFYSFLIVMIIVSSTVTVVTSYSIIYILYGLITALTESFNAVIIAFFRVKEKPRTVNAFIIIYSAISVITCLIVYMVKAKEASLVLYVLTYTVGMSLYIIFTMIRIRLYPLTLSQVIKKKALFTMLLGYSMPLTGNRLCLWFSTMGNRLILGMFCGTASIAKYTIAYNAASLIMEPLATLIMFTRYPKMIRLYDDNNLSGVSACIFSSIRLYLFVTGVLLTFFIGAPDLLAKVIGGVQYDHLGGTFLLLLPGIFAQCLSSYATKPYELTQKTKELFILLLSITVLNALLILITGKYWGAHGVALVRSISFVSYFVLLYYYGRKLMAWSFPIKTAASIFGVTIVLLLVKKRLMERIIMHTITVEILYAVLVLVVFGLIAIGQIRSEKKV